MEDENNSVKSSRRASREKQQKPARKFSLVQKRTAMAVGAVLLLGAGAAGLAIVKENTETISTLDAVEISPYVYFDGVQKPAGWSEKEKASTIGTPGIIKAQSLSELKRDDGKCTYSGQILFLPSYQNGRGDDFSTKEYLYQLGEAAGVAPISIESLDVQTDGKPLQTLSTSFEAKNPVLDPKTGKEVSSTKSYRSVAVRAIDNPVGIEGAEGNSDKGSYGSDGSKGLPMITLTYECSDKASFNADEWKKLVNSTKINVFSGIKPTTEAPAPETSPAPAESAPVAPTPASTESPVPDDTKETTTDAPVETPAVDVPASPDTTEGQS